MRWTPSVAIRERFRARLWSRSRAGPTRLPNGRPIATKVAVPICEGRPATPLRRRGDPGPGDAAAGSESHSQGEPSPAIDQSQEREMVAWSLDLRHVGSQKIRAVSATTCSFARWSATVMRLPMIDVEKPHCGERPSRSGGT